jgi:hypothetical protein
MHNHPARFLLFIFLSVFAGCVPVTPQTGSNDYVRKELSTKDAVYEPTIKTVILYPKLNTGRDVIQSPAIPLEQNNPLILSFDELDTEYKNLYVKVIHCTSDWKVSNLNSLEYMQDFNELLIRDYQVSQATKIPYTHYQIELPKVKISGNFLAVVYRNKNEDDILLSRRFIVFTNQIKINYNIRLSNVVQMRDLNQQIDFKIRYDNYDMINPRQNLKVVLKQNQRWDNAIFNLPPLFVREDQKELEYNYFNQENNFQGGNEFRTFDIRTVTSPGFNVATIQNNPSATEAILTTDKSRRTRNYILQVDLNGKFVVDNYDFSQNATIGSEYVYVTFNLQSEKLAQDVYVYGALTDWELKDEFRLNFDPEKNKYSCRVLLKQGYYNYAYATDNNGVADVSQVEGSHDDTENQYEIIAYYRPVGSRSEQVIGYVNVYYNSRN